MHVADSTRAERKLAQVGYYRLSGYWYPAREFDRDPLSNQPRTCRITGKPLRRDIFADGASFDDVVDLYRFDKHLRLLMLDAIERLEVNLKTVIAHVVGYHDPMAYADARFIKPKYTRDFVSHGKVRNKWNEWEAKQRELLNRSNEDAIRWHRLSGRPVPFWVAVEAWDFGTLSRYFEMLLGSYQNQVLARFGLDHAQIFARWLQEINLLRNRCAHHTRIWNQVSSNPLSVLHVDPFFATLNLDKNALARPYGLVCIIWFLLKKLAPNSDWIDKVADLVDRKPGLPGCTFAAFGLPAETGFPREAFGI
ncbi:abortive phage infection protein [Pseudomonas sp. 10-1B]|uniref:Abi family protein n=1 Tax=Pseudomonas sp. 10-1B TaxID=1546029 RepID=UPI00061F5DC6|nr:Abi family protein [Pseudomonas sp. 10-1B]KIY39132.1 abortive phage infection protein [Pseudomonas sp. 10-1B]